MAERKFINPEGMVRPGSYTPVVATRGGRTLYVAGQVAQNEQGELVGAGDLAAQAEQVYKNLGIALQSAGATFNDLVKITVYVVAMKPEHRDLMGKVRARHVSQDNPPASTLVGVQALAKPEYLVEVEAIAVTD
ncbi:MAG: RidA family protein [Betaproteobacteria bacterium]|nr:RidA family protein [Betaproteobacteria bacterium]